MASRLLERLRGLIREKRYVITWHATEELEESGLGLLDATNVVLSAWLGTQDSHV